MSKEKKGKIVFEFDEEPIEMEYSLPSKLEVAKMQEEVRKESQTPMEITDEEYRFVFNIMGMPQFIKARKGTLYGGMVEENLMVKRYMGKPWSNIVLTRELSKVLESIGSQAGDRYVEIVLGREPSTARVSPRVDILVINLTNKKYGQYIGMI